MSDASEPQPDRPRTWKPVVGAGAAALVVLAIALSTMAFGDNLTDVEEATIEACEAEYAQEDRTPILGGNIYEPAEMRDYYAVVETHGEVPVPLEDVTAEVTDQWDAAAVRYSEGDGGAVLLVWRLEDDTYAQCAVDFTSAGIDASSASVGPLIIAESD